MGAVLEPPKGVHVGRGRSDTRGYYKVATQLQEDSVVIFAKHADNSEGTKKSHPRFHYLKIICVLICKGYASSPPVDA
jgi:hypothetical protein